MLEIGAGLGALTRPLLARAKRVVAIERDRDLLPILAELFAGREHLQLLEADAVQVDWRAHLEQGPAPRVVAGNLPYQITGRLIEKTVGMADLIDRAVFMVQREVAERLAAAPGRSEYGALSVFTQAAFEVERAFKLPAGAFAPAPRVESAVVVLKPLSPPRAVEDEAFREVVKRAFNQRRKTLRNAWKALMPKRELEAAAAQAAVDLSARAETLAVEAFANMARMLRAQRRGRQPTSDRPLGRNGDH